MMLLHATGSESRPAPKIPPPPRCTDSLRPLTRANSRCEQVCEEAWHRTCCRHVSLPVTCPIAPLSVPLGSCPLTLPLHNRLQNVSPRQARAIFADRSSPPQRGLPLASHRTFHGQLKSTLSVNPWLPFDATLQLLLHLYTSHQLAASLAVSGALVPEIQPPSPLFAKGPAFYQSIQHRL
jgi:hypothetical protein